MYDPAFRTKLVIAAREAGFAFRAVAADSACGDQDGFRAELADAGLPFVMALRPRRGIWARAEDTHTPVKAARGGPEDPGDRTAVERTFRDRHSETWYAPTSPWAGGDRTAPGAPSAGPAPRGSRSNTGMPPDQHG
jgi:SRSO17 transposase